MNKEKKNMKNIDIELTQELFNGLEIISARLGITKNDIIRWSVSNLMGSKLNGHEKGLLCEDRAVKQYIDHLIE